MLERVLDRLWVESLRLVVYNPTESVEDLAGRQPEELLHADVADLRAVAIDPVLDDADLDDGEVPAETRVRLLGEPNLFQISLKLRLVPAFRGATAHDLLDQPELGHNPIISPCKSGYFRLSHYP
jgi:hypothetical protein